MKRITRTDTRIMKTYTDFLGIHQKFPPTDVTLVMMDSQKRLKLHFTMNLRKQTKHILTNLRFAAEDLECKTNMSERVFSASAPVHY